MNRGRPPKADSPAPLPKNTPEEAAAFDLAREMREQKEFVPARALQNAVSDARSARAEERRKAIPTEGIAGRGPIYRQDVPRLPLPSVKPAARGRWGTRRARGGTSIRRRGGGVLDAIRKARADSGFGSDGDRLATLGSLTGKVGETMKTAAPMFEMLKTLKGQTQGGRRTRREGGFLNYFLAAERKQMEEKQSAAQEEEFKRLEKQVVDAERFAKIKERLDAAGMELRGGGTRRTRRSGGDIVSHLLMIRNQIKLYHWQTKQFSRHTATDALTAALDLSIDNFVESYIGRYGRPRVSGSIKLHNFSESAATTFVARETKYLETDLPRKIGKQDTDLLNLRDEILAELTKVSYLFTLN